MPDLTAPSPTPTSTLPVTFSPADVAARTSASHVSSFPAGTLRLRMQVREAGYNPDEPAAVEALAAVAGVETAHLVAVFAGRAVLDRLTRSRISRTIGVAPTDSDPDADELLRRARSPRTISSIPRRQVRTAIANSRGW